MVSKKKLLYPVQKTMKKPLKDWDEFTFLLQKFWVRNQGVLSLDRHRQRNVGEDCRVVNRRRHRPHYGPPGGRELVG